MSDGERRDQEQRERRERRGEHTSHDQSILDQPKSPADPIALEPHQDLANDNTDNLEVRDGSNPVFVAYFMGRPAFGPDCRVEGGEVTDGEETKRETRRQLRLEARESRWWWWWW